MTFKYRILAVDDNSISLATIEQALKEKYEVTPLNQSDPAGCTDGIERRRGDAA